MDQTPSLGTPTPQPNEVGGRRSGRRRTKLLVSLSLAVLVVMGAFAYHLLAKRPITTLVPLPIPVALGGPRIPIFERNLEGAPFVPGEQRSAKESQVLRQPQNVTVARDGSRIYVPDTETRVVSVFDGQGAPLFSLGTEDEGALHAPIFAAAAPDGRVLVVDRVQNRVATYSPSGEFLGNFWPANMPATFKWAPLSVAIDAAGNVYMGDGEGAAYVFDKGGNLKLRLAPEEGTIMGAYAIAVNKAGIIAVSDTNRARVLVFRPDGTLDHMIGGLGLPRGVAIDDDGNVFVVDSVSHQVFMYDARGEPLHTFGQEGALDGQMQFPQAVALNGKGKIYVADRGNRRVQVWSY